jgi:hypothetical protein
MGAGPSTRTEQNTPTHRLLRPQRARRRQARGRRRRPSARPAPCRSCRQGTSTVAETKASQNQRQRRRNLAEIKGGGGGSGMDWQGVNGALFSGYSRTNHRIPNPPTTKRADSPRVDPTSHRRKQRNEAPFL